MQYTWYFVSRDACIQYFICRLANLIGLCMAYQISFLLLIVRDITYPFCNLVPLYFCTLYFVLLYFCNFCPEIYVPFVLI